MLVAGGLLGLFAFVGDELPGVAGTIILTLTSTGFAWGGAALLAGYHTASRATSDRAAVGRAVTDRATVGRAVTDRATVGRARRHAAAPVSATVLLLVATTVYYGLIVAHGRRWRLGELEDGSSSALVGLASVGRAAAFWLAASVAAGIVLGHLGAVVRRGSRVPASIAAGVALGLFAGQGLEFLLGVRVWGALDAFFLGQILSAATGVLLSTAGLPLLLALRRAPKSWPLFVTTSILAAAAGVLLWRLLHALTVAI
ncbi:hypothetical protein C1I93_24515 [Micromonospora endophytica]|uniref:Uncharacterized protein n=1 Tax=Micromonospora endophytica TaxID=515350 RepID=A0A2W2D8S2_9ACTN|nr:hypothetical protein C1I93_24515 [Micromonospora endophytica]RIW41072.1 hypothetical protein D3H59_27255 [Micromonospora endophytica]